MTSELSLADRIERLRAAYGEIGGPTPEQWDRLTTVPADGPLSLVNLFAFRETADYGGQGDESATGREAFDRYAAVSAPALAQVGGRFVHFGGHRGNLVGEDETWDLVVVGEYPDLDALLALHEDPAYRDAYRHRVAACSAQRVLISS